MKNVSITSPPGNGWDTTYVKLDVELPANYEGPITLSYEGDKLSDISDAKNKAPEFSQVKVDTNPAKEIVSATVSSDRQFLNFEVNPGRSSEFNKPGNSKDSIKVFVDDKAITEFTVGVSSSLSHFSHNLTFANPLPAGAVRIEFISDGLKDYALDPYPSTMETTNITFIPAPELQTAEYQGQNIVLTYNEDFTFSNTSNNAAGFLLKIDEVVYELRGFIIYGYDNRLTVEFYGEYEQLLRQKLDEGTDIQLKYNSLYPTNRQVSDSAGSRLPDFDYITVTKN